MAARTGRAAAAALLSAAALLGSGGAAAPEPECEVSEILEPDCGVWWGASSRDGWPGVAALEATTGREFDIVYRWHGVDEAALPNDTEREIIAEGRFLHTNIEAKEFTKPGSPATRYRRIIEGGYDSALHQQARNFAELEAPVFLTFDHEADASKRYNQRGTPQEFVRAWRHIVDIYRANGADNVIWVWNVTGWAPNFARLPSLWPGNDYVDWISWEAYNMTDCELHPNWRHVQSFEESFSPMYEWIQENGARHGIDPGKPVMIGEMGTVPISGDPRSSYRWYRDIPEVLHNYERIRAVKLWDSLVAPTCDFRVRRDIATKLGFITASRDPYVNIPAAVREAVALS